MVYGANASFGAARGAFHHWKEYTKNSKIQRLANLILYALNGEIHREEERFSSWYDSKWVKRAFYGFYSVACLIPFTDFIENGVIPVRYSSSISVISVLAGAIIQQLKESFDKRVDKRERHDKELEKVKVLYDSLSELNNEESRTDRRIGKIYKLFEGLPDHYKERIYKTTTLNERDIYRLLLDELPSSSKLKEQFAKAQKGILSTHSSDDEFSNLVNMAVSGNCSDIPALPTTPPTTNLSIGKSAPTLFSARRRGEEATSTSPSNNTELQVLTTWGKWAEERDRKKTLCTDGKCEEESFGASIPPVSSVEELTRIIYATLEPEFKAGEGEKKKWYASKWGTAATYASIATACILPISDLIKRGIVPNKYSSLLSVGAVASALELQQRKKKFEEKTKAQQEKEKEAKQAENLYETLEKICNMRNRTDPRVGKLFQQFEDLPDRMKHKIYKAVGLSQGKINRLITSQMPDGTALKNQFLAFKDLEEEYARRMQEEGGQPPALTSKVSDLQPTMSTSSSGAGVFGSLPPTPRHESPPKKGMLSHFRWGQPEEKQVIPLSTAEQAGRADSTDSIGSSLPDELKHFYEVLGDLDMFDFSKYTQPLPPMLRLPDDGSELGDSAV